MTAPVEHDVRRQAIRVALGATAIVAVVYLALSAGVLGILTRNLTEQVDDRLRTFLDTQAPRLATSGRAVGDDGERHDGDDREHSDDGERQFGPPTLAWRVAADGIVTYVGPMDYAVALPAATVGIAAPQTVVINGTALRMTGQQVGSVRIVAAETIDAVTDAQTTLILAEALIAPILLGVVFLGAVIIGRRVADPIEAARRRQLEFTADASHELRTPLSVIEAHASLGLTGDRSVAWYRDALGKVNAEARRMRGLLEDMLWLARFDATRDPGRHEPTDLGLVARGAADRFQAVAEARRITLRAVAPAVDVAVAAPADWLDRVAGVLIDNACKYAPEGGSVEVAVRSEHGRASLTVDDSGPGIPEDQRARIFDRFHRATDARSGAGLGLAIADTIVRATNATWGVGVSPLGGARVSVSWPVAGASRAPARRTDPRTDQRSDPRSDP